MMKERILQFFSFFYFLLGGTLVIVPFSGITGFSIIENMSSYTLSILGIMCILLGSLIATIARREVSELEQKLVKPAPGKGIGPPFVKLSNVIERGSLISNKIHVEVKDQSIYRNGRPIQGLKLNGEYVEFLGYHFTSPSAAYLIENDEEFIVKNRHDPYIYFLEPMDYNILSEKEKQYITGANSASDVLIAKVKYPLEKVYLKFQKGTPTSIAIGGDINPEDLIKRKGRYIDHKKSDEL